MTNVDDLAFRRHLEAGDVAIGTEVGIVAGMSWDVKHRFGRVTRATKTTLTVAWGDGAEETGRFSRTSLCRLGDNRSRAPTTLRSPAYVLDLMAWTARRDAQRDRLRRVRNACNEVLANPVGDRAIETLAAAIATIREHRAVEAEGGAS